jgi:hypothetical protein
MERASLLGYRQLLLQDGIDDSSVVEHSPHNPKIQGLRIEREREDTTIVVVLPKLVYPL